MAQTTALNPNTTMIMNDVLTELGWNTGVHLPIATIENQQLQRELERLIHARAAVNSHLLQTRNKRQELENHNKHLSQEQVEISSLLTTQRSTKQAENDQLVVLDLEYSKLSQDIKEFKKKEKGITDRENNLRNTLCNLFKRLEELKKTVSYDTDAIRLWEDSLLKTEEDNAIIKKFSEQDQNKAKELELKRQKLHKELDLRQRTLDKLLNETNGIEVALNKSHQMYLDAKKDRTNLLNQWHETVQHLRQRHKDIHLINMEIERLRETLAKKIEDTEEQNTFYLNQLNNNRETEKQTEDLAKETARCREKLMNTINTVRDVMKELHIGKYELASLENTLHQSRSKCKQLEYDISNKKEQLKQTNNTNNNLTKQLENLKNKKMTTNERARELQKMVNNTQNIVNALTLETERLQKIVFRSSQQAKKLHDIDDAYQIEIRGLKLGIELMEKQEKALEQEVQATREDVYDFDYNILQIESRIENIEGTARDQFNEELENKLQELLSILKEKNNIKQTLTKQISSIQDDIRRFGFQFANDNIELAKLQETLHKELKMVEGGKRMVKAGQIRSQEKQVEENILRLRVMQAQKHLENIDDSLYTLEKQRIEMETAMKERQIEIGTERDVLSLRKRNLLEDKSNLRGEIQERLIKNEQYKKKFEYQVSLLGTDEDGKPLSPTYYKLKKTQERVLLQQEGDEWDLKVKQAEQEIVAMENTLKLVNISNDKFKMSLDPVEEAGPEEEEFKKIEQEHYCILKKLRATQRKQIECGKIMENLTEEMKIVDDHLLKFDNEKSRLENDLAVSKKDISLQEDRLTRAKRTLSRLSMKVRPTLQQSFEKEISVRNLIENNQSAIQQILELSIRHLETSPNITRLCDYYRITLPGIEKFRPIPRRLSQLSILPPTSADQSIHQSATSETTNSIYNAAKSFNSFQSVSTTNIQFSSTDLPTPSGASSDGAQIKSTSSSKKKK